MMEAESEVGNVRATNNNLKHSRVCPEEPMVVDLENEDETRPAPKLVTDGVKKNFINQSILNHSEQVRRNFATNANDQFHSEDNGGLEVLDGDDGDNPIPTVLIGKQTSGNFGDFIQPASIFKRTISKEPGQSSRTSSRNDEQPEQTDEKEEEAGHLDGWIEDVMEAINDPFLIKKEATALADLCKVLNRPRLVINKGQIKDHHGYEIDGTTYLWAEEALYLIETGRLELYVDEVAASVERSRALLLHSKNADPTLQSDDVPEILTCENDEYTVYKYFAKLGYRIRRRESMRYSKKLHDVNAGNVDTNVVNLEVDPDELFEQEDELQSFTTDSSMLDYSHLLNPEATTASSSTQAHFVSYEEDRSKRGKKRKAALGLISEDEESCGDGSESVKSFGDSVSNHGYSFVTDELMEEAGFLEESQYTVVEADDSDVEFVDEVIFTNSLVDIQELELSDPNIDDLENLPGTSTAQHPKPVPVILDLVSSSDSDCEEITNESIWSDFSSVKIFEMKFPPGHLLPDNIPARADSKVYTYSRNQEGVASKSVKTNEGTGTGVEEMEIEKNADELKLDSTTSPGKWKADHEYERVKCDSWKEWRNLIMTEARDVLNESLLGSQSTAANDNDVTEKLNLWPKQYDTTSSDSETNLLRIPFDLFPIVNRNVSKHHLWTKIQPLYHVAIVRTTDPVLSSQDMEARLKTFNDNVPLLIALINDDSDVMVFSSDLKPLPSLF